MKKELQLLTNEFVKFQQEKDLAIQKLSDSGMYSEEHLHQLQNEFYEEVQSKKVNVVAKCRGTVETAKDSFIEKLSVKPENYDIKLNTTLAIINATNGSFDADELKEWLRPFKNHYKTMLMFSKIVTGEKKLPLMVYERIPELIKLYEKVYGCMDTYLTEPTETVLNLGGAFGLMFAADSIDSKTEDILNTIIEW